MEFQIGKRTVRKYMSLKLVPSEHFLFMVTVGEPFVSETRSAGHELLKKFKIKIKVRKQPKEF